MIMSTLLFALAHGAIQQSLIAAVFGLVLAYVAIQTNCLFCCIAFHATHNALGLFAADWLPRWGAVPHKSPWLIHAVANYGQDDLMHIYGIGVLLPALAMAGLLLTWFARRTAGRVVWNSPHLPIRPA
jgi:sodium transport system permease protein